MTFNGRVMRKMFPVYLSYFLPVFLLQAEGVKHVQKIPHAKLVTPNATENVTEPTPVMIGNMTSLPKPRIIGGEETDIKKYPFMVNVLRDNRHWCGGSYVMPTWILTAAHCLLHPKTFTIVPARVFSVRMGSTTLEDDGHAQERVAVNVVPHADFHTHNNSCDIGLIEIDRPFEISDRVDFVTIPSIFETYEGKNCTVVGWGITHYLSEEFSDHLLKVTIPVVPQSLCKKIYSLPKYQNLFENHRTICAGVLQGGKDACQGDSGGPLVLEGTQVGLVSWGIGCGNEIPGVYTNIYYYSKWIEDITANTPMFGSRTMRKNLAVSTSSTYLSSLCTVFVLVYFKIRQ